MPIPAMLAAELYEHLATRPGTADAFVFTAPDGGPLRHECRAPLDPELLDC